MDIHINTHNKYILAKTFQRSVNEFDAAATFSYFRTLKIPFHMNNTVIKCGVIN